MKRILSIVLVPLLLGGCENGGGPGGAANVQVSFATQRPAAVQAHVAGPADTLVVGADTLIITDAEIVLREVELRRALADSCLDDDDACEEFETGPVLVALPTSPGVRQQFALEIPADTYDRVEFDLHKPSDDDPADQAFIAAHPDFADISVRVQGTFNGTAFVFTSDVNEEQELVLSPPLVVSEDVGTNLTVFVDLSAWFRTVTGALVDPATANKGEPNENLVRDNIRTSFEAFEDPDLDGSQND